MGMGYAAGYADVVSPAFIEKMCPKEWSTLVAELYKDKFTMDDLAVRLQMEDDLSDEQLKAFQELVKAFDEKTGLELWLGYQDPDHGDIYDDISESYWCVGGVYTYTKAGKKYQKEIQRKSFVMFG